MEIAQRRAPAPAVALAAIASSACLALGLVSAPCALRAASLAAGGAEAVWDTLAGPCDGSAAPNPCPVGRPDALLVLDPDARGMQVIGGDCRGDQWHFARDAASPWTPIAVRGSPECGPHATVRDPKRNRLYSMGTSYANPNELQGEFRVDTLPLDGPRAWSRQPVTGEGPGSILWTSMVLDPRRDRILMFGGGDQFYLGDDCAQDSDRVWQLSLGDTCRWSRLVAEGSPGARDFQASVYDPHGDRLIVVGGEFQSFGSYCLGARKLYDTWSLSLGEGRLAWTRLDTQAPLPIAPIVLDTLRDRLVMFGDDMTPWALSLDDPQGWRALAVPGLRPQPRSDPGLAFDGAGDEVIVFGGAYISDVYALRFLTPVTRQVSLAVAASGNAAADRPRMLDAAVLGSSSLAVDSILVASIRLAGAPVLGRPPVSRRDVNRDGFPDLVFAVDRATAAGGAGDTALAFVAQAVHGARLVGSLALHGKEPDLRGVAHLDGADPVDDALPGLHVLGPVRAGDALSLAYRLGGAPGPGTRAQVSVYDVAGRRVATRDLDSGTPAATIALDEMRGRLPGVYFVRLVQGAWSAHARAVVLP